MCCSNAAIYTTYLLYDIKRSQLDLGNHGEVDDPSYTYHEPVLAVRVSFFNEYILGEEIEAGSNE